LPGVLDFVPAPPVMPPSVDHPCASGFLGPHFFQNPPQNRSFSLLLLREIVRPLDVFTHARKSQLVKDQLRPPNSFCPLPFFLTNGNEASPPFSFLTTFASFMSISLAVRREICLIGDLRLLPSLLSVVHSGKIYAATSALLFSSHVSFQTVFFDARRRQFPI